MSRSRQKKADGIAVMKRDGKTVAARSSGFDARAFLVAVLVLAGWLLIWAFFSVAGMNARIAGLAEEGWARSSSVIARNRIHALLHGALMLFASAAFLWLFLFGKIGKKAVRNAAMWGIVLLIAADSLWLSRRYVQTMPASFVASNDLVRILSGERDYRRVALATQQGFYNALLTYTFPFHGIRTLNVTQMPRMPDDYRTFLDALSRNSPRLWQLCAVGYVIGPAQIMKQIGDDPALRDSFELVYSFNMLSCEDGGMMIAAGTEAHPGEHVVLRLKAASARYALLAGWTVSEDAETLANLRSDEFHLFRRALVAPECADGLPESAGEGITGFVSVREYRAGRVVLNISTDRPAILRAADKYDADWRATVDGKPVPLRRVDYLFQGVFIEPGLREVVLSYRPDTLSLWALASGLLVCIGAAASLVYRRQ